MFKNLSANLRFYILGGAVAGSVLLISWLRLQIPSDQLFIIRTEQVCGYATLLLWYGALLISPLSKRYSGWKGMPYLIFSRRAIGVSAAYFAALHVCITLWGQIGGLHGIALLPERFVWSLVFGLVGFIVLCAMAATSFNKVIAFMTFKRWKMLHRLGYIGGILVLLHIWLIGTHLAYISFRTVIFVLLCYLFWLEAQRLGILLAKKYRWLAGHRTIVAVVLWVVTVLLLWSVPQVIGSYTDRHTASGAQAPAQLGRLQG